MEGQRHKADEAEILCWFSQSIGPALPAALPISTMGFKFLVT